MCMTCIWARINCIDSFQVHKPLEQSRPEQVAAMEWHPYQPEIHGIKQIASTANSTTLKSGSCWSDMCSTNCLARYHNRIVLPSLQVSTAVQTDALSNCLAPCCNRTVPSFSAFTSTKAPQPHICPLPSELDGSFTICYTDMHNKVLEVLFQKESQSVASFLKGVCPPQACKGNSA